MYLVLSVLGLAVIAFGFAFAAERQKEIVAAADGLLAQLKPEYRERTETEKRFNALEGAMADVKSLLREMADELKNNRTQSNA